MEYAARILQLLKTSLESILVLMEYICEMTCRCHNLQNKVLILVLMEYALQRPPKQLLVLWLVYLNPCFNGIYIRVLTKMSLTYVSRLNPCFNGICSASYYSAFNNSGIDSLNPCFNGICSASEEILFKAHT